MMSITFMFPMGNSHKISLSCILYLKVKNYASKCRANRAYYNSYCVRFFLQDTCIVQPEGPYNFL